jgi:ATP-binding cassette subfamily B multidrug efflux pump
MASGNSTTPQRWIDHPIVRLLRVYAWRFRWSYFAGGLFLILTNYLAVSIPGQIGHAVDALRAGTPVDVYVWTIAAMGVAVIIVRTTSRILIFNPGRHQEYLIRRDVFAKLMRLQPSFFATTTRGDIVSRASNDVTWVRTLVGFGGLQVMNVATAVTLTGWKMVEISPRLTLATVLPIAIGLIIVQWAIRRVFTLSRRAQEQLGEISEHVLGSLQGMGAIQGFSAEDAFIKRFEERNEGWLKTSLRLAVIRSVALPLLVLAGGLATYLLVAVGGPLALSGALSVGELAAFAALLTVLMPPLRSLGWLLSVVARGRAALERIFELLDAPEDRPDRQAPVAVQAGRGPALSLRGLSFAYPGSDDRPVLQDVSVELPAGAMIGLFGRTGSGKSTLLSLIARLFNPPRGTLFVDGRDILDLDLESWRRCIAMAPQRPFLFSDTIATNIALSGSPDEEAVAESVRLAAMDGDVRNLPDGLETTVGERGIMLSGGQRQRVALARGLHRQADLLILDDVLSAVDHTTESRLIATLAEFAHRPQAPTVMIASHRLSALRRTDLVLVLDQGRLVDQGTHAELIERPGLYRDTWHAQKAGTKVPEEAAS